MTRRLRCAGAERKQSPKPFNVFAGGRSALDFELDLDLDLVLVAVLGPWGMVSLTCFFRAREMEEAEAQQSAYARALHPSLPAPLPSTPPFPLSVSSRSVFCNIFGFSYSSKDLTGMKVKHGSGEMKAGELHAEARAAAAANNTTMRLRVMLFLLNAGTHQLLHLPVTLELQASP